MEKALESIKWLQDVFVTRRKEQGFEVHEIVENNFKIAIKELEEAIKPKTYVLDECLCCGECKHYNGKEEKTCQIVSGWHEENFYCNKFEV